MSKKSNRFQDDKETKNKQRRGRNSKGANNRKSGRNSDNRFGKSDQSNLPEHDMTTDNDISFWNGAGQLYVDATTISTYSALGAKHVSPFLDKPYYSPTGICRFDYVPYFGSINTSVHPINTTAKIIYNAINAKNSRMPSYDPSDLMIYIMAVAQAWSIHAWIRRLCGMFNTFSVINRYWWEPICRSMGVAPISTDNDIVTWRNLANHIALLLNRLPVPNGIRYFDRAAWMNMNIYMDSPVGKATYFYFSPAGVLKYDYDENQVGKLAMVETPWHKYTTGTSTELVTPKSVETFFMDVISNLFNDSDIPVIGADIMKAFDGNIYTIGQIDSSFVLAPGYSPEVNLELHNARLHYGGESLVKSGQSNTYSLVQDMTTNTIRTKELTWDMPGVPSTGFVATDLAGNRAIAMDFPIDNPGNDDWMTATRLLWAAVPPAAPNSYADILCGTEMLINDEEFEFVDVDGKWELNGLPQCAIVNSTGTSATLLKALNKLERISKLHDSPITFYIQPNGNSSQYKDPTSMKILDDLTNYSVITAENLRNLHDVADRKSVV